MKNITKKIAVFALTCVMAMGFAGCESEKVEKNDNSDVTTVADDNSQNNDNINANAGGDETAPPANNGGNAETFKDYSNKTVENGKSASWLWIDTGSEDLPGDSDIFEITFKIKDGSADGNYNVVINELQICNVATDIVDAKIVDGVVTVGGAQAPSAETVSEPSISLVNVQGNAGDTVKMKVNFSNNPGFCAITMGINYDSSVLEIENVTNTGVLEGIGSLSMNLGD